MIVTSIPTVPGKTIVQVLGIAQGNTVRSKNIGRDIAASFKTIVGGELKGYTEMLTEARQESYNRMINDAIRMKADAIVNVRYMTSAVMQGAAELLAYGTAVKLK